MIQPHQNPNPNPNPNPLPKTKCDCGEKYRGKERSKHYRSEKHALWTMKEPASPIPCVCKVYWLEKIFQDAGRLCVRNKKFNTLFLCYQCGGCFPPHVPTDEQLIKFSFGILFFFLFSLFSFFLFSLFSFFLFSLSSISFSLLSLT